MRPFYADKIGQMDDRDDLSAHVRVYVDFFRDYMHYQPGFYQGILRSTPFPSGLPDYSVRSTYTFTFNGIYFRVFQRHYRFCVIQHIRLACISFGM